MCHDYLMLKAVWLSQNRELEYMYTLPGQYIGNTMGVYLWPNHTCIPVTRGSLDHALVAFRQVAWEFMTLYV